MGYFCKTCMTYWKDYTGEGWEGMGWQAEDRCATCTDDDFLLVATNPFVQRLRKEIQELRRQRDNLIRSHQKRTLLQRKKQCVECADNVGRLHSITEAYYKAVRAKQDAYDMWAEQAIGQAPQALEDE